MNRMMRWAAAQARAKRALALLDLIKVVRERNGRCRIIDLGGELPYWRAIGLDKLRALGVELTLVNPRPIVDAVGTSDPGIALKYINADACGLEQFDDFSFDVAHSNSTIEHVGEWDSMQAFAGQLRRLAPAYYVQTPYVWFPIEPHFRSLGFHWLPEQMRARRLMTRRYGFHPREETMDGAMRVVRSARLLDRRQMESLFPDAHIVPERVGGLIKSLVGIRETGAPMQYPFPLRVESAMDGQLVAG